MVITNNGTTAMADSFTQFYVQVVFATKGRRQLLHKSFRKKVFSYIGGILKGHQQIPLAINGVSNHIHIFFIYKPHILLSDLVRDIKRDSTKFINEQHFTTGRFSWQPAYGGFSYGRSQIGRVIKYIENQERHHHKMSFRDEVDILLRKYDAPENPYGWFNR